MCDKLGEAASLLRRWEDEGPIDSPLALGTEAIQALVPCTRGQSIPLSMRAPVRHAAGGNGSMPAPPSPGPSFGDPAPDLTLPDLSRRACCQSGAPVDAGEPAVKEYRWYAPDIVERAVTVHQLLSDDGRYYPGESMSYPEVSAGG